MEAITKCSNESELDTLKSHTQAVVWKQRRDNEMTIQKDKEIIERLKKEVATPKYDSEFIGAYSIGFVLDFFRALTTNKIYSPIRENASKYKHPYAKLTPSMKTIMDALYNLKTCESITKLAQYTGLSYKNIYRVLDKLVKIGYVELQHKPDSVSNTKEITMTKLGMDSMQTHSDLALYFIKDRLNRYLTEDEQKELVYHSCKVSQLLRKISPFGSDEEQAEAENGNDVNSQTEDTSDTEQTDEE
ncbi:MAG: MarR family winged helix-turn-helix transcriptional regulator [Clostridia bacterium]|nr:MarR family winged helix-turn-helix transcriptional regulator [Clostridia bacterium]